jgi:aminopeptidase-like protein
MTAGLAAEIERYFDRLWPLTRSLTGDGVRATHDILSELAPLERTEVPSGSRVLDWIVPPEWVVRDAHVVDPDGRRILDVHENNLHLVGYSVPFRGVLSREELDGHLHSLPAQPTAIPYLTSYYSPHWGFCLAHEQRERLPEGEYEVVVDTELRADGSLTLGEAVLPGEEPGEVLLSTYTCHPSLANNELSGPLVAAFLYRRVAAWPRRRLGYRFVFVPETIGAIAYLARRGDHLRERLLAGYVITCIGDPGPFTLKRSRRGDTLADRAAAYVLGGESDVRVVDFFPSGSDERQYCSPGFDLPVASVMRTMYGTYPEYHTSLDNRDFISFSAMAESVDTYERILRTLDANVSLLNTYPYGEPQLGRRGLYPSLGSSKETDARAEAMLWILNQSDGEHDLLDIAARSGVPMELIVDAADDLIRAGLLERADSRAVRAD